MKYSKKQIEKAGFDLISAAIESDKNLLSETMNVLTDWRDSHITALDICENFLKSKVYSTDSAAFIAKRIKRTESIVKKLKRFNKMSLKNMQDIGGIRIVLANNKKVKKDFDMCRLQRHYIIKTDGTTVYNYYEGSVGNCYKSEPRETYWKITKDKIVFFIGNEIYQEEKIVNFSPQNMIFNSIPLDASNEKDPLVAKILQTVHYENLEKISEEQLQQQLLH